MSCTRFCLKCVSLILVARSESTRYRQMHVLYCLSTMILRSQFTEYPIQRQNTRYTFTILYTTGIGHVILVKSRMASEKTYIRLGRRRHSFKFALINEENKTNAVQKAQQARSSNRTRNQNILSHSRTLTLTQTHTHTCK